MSEGFDPSVAQPPLPLQLFLPLQPLSLALQPPLPLQSFLPLQACLSGASWPTMRMPAETALTLLWPEPLLTGCAAAMVPPTRPVSVALSRSAFREVFIFDFLAWVLAESIR